MLKLNDISLQRGGHYLLQEAQASINPGQRVALIGANGSGKSSLFQLIQGKLDADRGEVLLPKGWRIAHMAQEVDGSTRNAVDYVLDGDSALRSAQQRLADAEATDNTEQQVTLHALIEDLGAYDATHRAKQLLMGLGFSVADLSKQVNEFSGGWRIRLNLAQALMKPSDLLLLDEPTNHLDIDASLWLENWLSAYSGTLLLISHDREFIDGCCQYVVHIDQQRLQTYKGNYSAFERLRAEKLAQQQQAYEKQQDQIAHMESFVRRFKAKATKAKQAQSRVKALERMQKVLPAHIDSPFNFEFREPEKTSDPLLSLQKADVGYGETVIVSGINLTLHADLRLGVLGANGAGKSTVIKTLAEEITILGGSKTPGEHLKVGYFSQHQLEALDMAASPLLHIQRMSPTVSEQQIRDFLGGFNFIGAKALDTVRLFSGGEKARLALAIIVWQRPNLLLLDEPTNHLDLDMRHALNVALQSFQGAVLLVSHDRHLLKNVCDEYILVSDGALTPFDGTLDDYRAWLLAKLKQASQSQGDNSDDDQSGSDAADVTQAGGMQQSDLSRKEQRQLAAQARQQFAPLKKKLRSLEASLENLEQRSVDIEALLADEAIYEAARREELSLLVKEQGQLRAKIEEQETEWLALSEEIEALSEQS